MAKKFEGKRGEDIQDPAGKPVKADSGSAGEGSENRGIWINEFGDVCYGSECVSLAIDQKRREVRVKLKSSPSCKLDPLVESLRGILGEGAKTLYEVESEHKLEKASNEGTQK